MAPPDTLLLLHLSDLHFGHHSRFENEKPADLGRKLHAALEEARAKLALEPRITLVVVTGDIVEAAMPKEYRKAQEFFSALVDALELDRSRFVFLPGNHDISWTLCRGVEEEDDYREEELRRRLDEVKLRNFEAFTRDFYGATDLSRLRCELVPGACLYNFEDLEVSVAALSSCERESHRPGDHFGELGEEQARSLMNAWSGPRLSTWLKIVAIHHNTDTVHSDVFTWRKDMRDLVEKGQITDEILERYASDLLGFKGKEHLEAIVRDRCPQLILHGHKHATKESSMHWQGKGYAHVLSAGSWGARASELPKDQPNSLRLILLDTKGEEIRAHALVYDPRARAAGEVSLGSWTLDAAERDGYVKHLDLPPGRRGPMPTTAEAVSGRTHREGLEEALKSPGERSIWMAPGDDLLPCIAALANDLGETERPGFILIRLSDQELMTKLGLRGLAQSSMANEVLGRVRSGSRLFPPLEVTGELISHQGESLVVVCVEPYPVPPTVKVDDVPYVRTNGSIVRASAADLARLDGRRPVSSMSFDLRPLDGTTIDDLDLIDLRPRHAADQMGPSERLTFEDWLTTKELGRLVKGKWVPSPAAILLYGKSPQTYIRAACVEFVRYGGAGVHEPLISRKPITGTLPNQLKEIWAQIEANIVQVPAPEQGPRTPYVMDYPPEALKELARNLLQHRDYEKSTAPGRIEWFNDRVVFTNPGGPFGCANEGEFGSLSDYRNPAITQGLKDMGYVEQLGRGIRVARAALSKNGNPPLEIEKDGYTIVTVRRRS